MFDEVTEAMAGPRCDVQEVLLSVQEVVSLTGASTLERLIQCKSLPSIAETKRHSTKYEIPGKSTSEISQMNNWYLTMRIVL